MPTAEGSDASLPRCEIPHQRQSSLRLGPLWKHSFVERTGGCYANRLRLTKRSRTSRSSPARLTVEMMPNHWLPHPHFTHSQASHAWSASDRFAWIIHLEAGGRCQVRELELAIFGSYDSGSSSTRRTLRAKASKEKGFCRTIPDWSISSLLEAACSE
jgi:hypothetical protein